MARWDCLTWATIQVHMSNTELNSIDLTNKSSMNMPIGQHPHAQQQPPNYVKIWQVRISSCILAFAYTQSAHNHNFQLLLVI
jgi:hypothetical protein